MSKETPLSTEFKIRFDKKSKRYAKVFIFRDKETMYKFYSEQKKIDGSIQPNELIDKGELDFKAMFQPFEIYKFKNKKETIGNHTGNFLFNWNELGSGIVAHEAGHAALHWFEIHNGNKNIKNMEYEEDLLWTLGYLIAQFWTVYYKLSPLNPSN